MSYGLKKQISKLDPKMGYFGGPNKALENMDLKTKVGLIWGEENKPYGKKKKRRRGAKIKPTRYGNYFEHGFCMDHMEFKA